MIGCDGFGVLIMGLMVWMVAVLTFVAIVWAVRGRRSPPWQGYTRGVSSVPPSGGWPAPLWSPDTPSASVGAEDEPPWAKGDRRQPGIRVPDEWYWDYPTPPPQAPPLPDEERP